MEPPGITRRRRPFLLPVWLIISTAALVLAVLLVAYLSATTTVVILTRHAERDTAVIQDPPLSPEGEQRAQRLAQMFGSGQGVGRIDAIYVSDTRRTQQTAEPLAERLGKKPIVLSAADIKGTVARVMREHGGGVSLIIGHSNTVPQLIEALADIRIAPIADDEYDTLYVVAIPTFGKPSVLRLEY
ncbi:MAG TPA: phosphoglycerate mutase family protein [Steroidobacteraceae bacterium]|nr:phosphoglycerate mutase family protein [Steroidobacteraceae bacterium]